MENDFKIDRRRHYVLVLDTETANTIQEDNKLDMSNVLFYDCGWAVADIHGNIYRTRSYVNRDIFCYERELMQSAYYAQKIPRYVAEIQCGMREMADLYEIRQAFLADLAEFEICEIVAHNARFDVNSLNTTQRYVTQSKYRYFLPYGIEVWDTMGMARDVICNMPTYKQFCKDNGYMTANNQVRKTAEILYRFISGNKNFYESHTGLEDVLIEVQIMAYCYRQHKPMPHKVLYASKADNEKPPHSLHYWLNEFPIEKILTGK